MNRLRIVELNSPLEEQLGGILGSKGVLQVEQRDPNVQLLSLLPEIDSLQRSVTDIPSLSDLRDLELERHVLDPEEGRVGRSEEESLEVACRFGCSRLEVGGEILLDGLLLLLGLGGIDSGSGCVVVGVGLVLVVRSILGGPGESSGEHKGRASGGGRSLGSFGL